MVNQKVAVLKLGCRVDVAADGREAVSMLAMFQYDLVFMDCQMPEMDGFAATTEIRSREQQSGGHVPIVGLTANAMEGYRQACLDAGMDDYIAKPAHMDNLRRIVDIYHSGFSAEDTRAETRQDIGEVLDSAAVPERVGPDPEL